MSVYQFLRTLREQRLKEYNIEGMLVSFDGISGAGKGSSILEAEEDLRLLGFTITSIRESSMAWSPERERIKATTFVERNDPDATLDSHTRGRQQVWRVEGGYGWRMRKDSGFVPLVLLMDRSAYGTFAHQVLARDIQDDEQQMEKLARRLFPGSIIPPHLAFFLDCSPEVARQRRHQRRLNIGITVERRKKEDPRLRQIYEQICQAVPDGYFINNDQPREWLHPDIFTILTQYADRYIKRRST